MEAGSFFALEISLCGFDSREPFSWKHDACAFEIYYLVYSYSITLKLCYIRSRVSPTYRPCIIQNLKISALSPSFCDLPGTSEDPSVAKTNLPILRFSRVWQTKNQVSEGRARTPQVLVSFPASLTRENMVSTCRRIVLERRNEPEVLEHSRAITPRQLALVRFFILAEQSRFDSPFIELWPSSLPVLIARYRHFSHWLLDNGAR